MHGFYGIYHLPKTSSEINPLLKPKAPHKRKGSNGTFLCHQFAEFKLAVSFREAMSFLIASLGLNLGMFPNP